MIRVYTTGLRCRLFSETSLLLLRLVRRQRACREQLGLLLRPDAPRACGADTRPRLLPRLRAPLPAPVVRQFDDTSRRSRRALATRAVGQSFRGVSAVTLRGLCPPFPRVDRKSVV